MRRPSLPEMADETMRSSAESRWLSRLQAAPWPLTDIDALKTRRMNRRDTDPTRRRSPITRRIP